MECCTFQAEGECCLVHPGSLLFLAIASLEHAGAQNRASALAAGESQSKELRKQRWCKGHWWCTAKYLQCLASF